MHAPADDAKPLPLVFNGDKYSLSVSKAGKNKSKSQQYCILLNSTSSASRRQVATSVDRDLLTRVVAKATSKAAQRSFRGRAPDAFAHSSSLLRALKQILDDTRQEVARERPQSSTDPSQIQARVARRPKPPPPPLPCPFPTVSCARLRSPSAHRPEADKLARQRAAPTAPDGRAGTWTT